MTGAEAIIQEYLDRGYSMRALRLLAESWSGAVGARMLAILDGMSPEPGKESDPENASVRAPDNVSGNVSENASGEAAAEDSGPCETAAYPVADAEADVVYFVADDEEAASREETVDEVAGEAVDSGADIMAETAAEGDSVADILIGETEGSEILRPRSASGGEGKAGLIAAEAGRHQEQNGILNRLWSRVAAKAGPTVTQPFAHTLALYEARRHVAGQAGQTGNSESGQWGGAERGGEKAAADPDESPMSADGSTVSEVAGSEMFFEAIAEESSAMLTEAAEVLSEAARTRPAAEPEAEPESEPEPSGEGPESPVRPEGPPAGPGGGRDRAEMDSDYIPRQDGDLYEEVAVGGGAGVPVTAARARRALMEAQAALDAPENAAGSGEKEKEKENGGTAEGPTPEGTGKISRRERRRRERAQKKKEKKTKKPGVDDALPEIVLTRSEGTETMMPEVCGIAAGGNGSAGAPETDGEATERGFAEPSAVGESVSLLTPHDLLGESSSAAELFAFDGDAPAEEAERRESPERDERPEQAEEAGEIASPEAIEHESEADVATDVAIEAESEFPVEPGDHLMIIAGGGIPYEDYSRLVDESGDAAVRDGGKDWEEESNVILFNEKFPVFAGVRGEELDEYDEEGEESAVASGYLRLLPTGSFESEDEAGEGGEGSEADVIPYPSLRVLEYAGPAEEPAEILAEAPTEELAEEPIEEPLAEEPVEEPAAEPAAESIAEPMAEPAAELIALSGFEPEPSSTRHELGAADRLVLFRAVYGMAADSEVVDAESEAEALSLHAIVSEEPESQPVDALEREAAVRAEMEAEYQKRLDEFAGRILQAELAVATEKERVRQKQTELEARSAIIEEMQKRAAAEALQADSMAGRLAEANSGVDERDRKLRAKDKELEAFAGMREEHLRLYNEFEDLRRAYNEVVSDVLPKLQGERDDLALTVERQCSSEDRLRLSLGTVRRRMAVGYSLAGAACLALCALPVANWLSSGKTERQAAEDRQKMAELHETLQREVQNNIVARNTIVELENKMGMARAQLSDLHKKNQELARLSRSRQPQGQNQDVAVFKPPSPQSAGTPARTSDMALQATVPAGGRLHVNQVRDPSGSIEELALQNRYLHTQPQSGSAPSRQMAGSGESPRAVPMSMAARSDVGQGMRPRGDESAPPVAMVRNVGARQGSRLPARAEIPRQDEVVTRVKKGEGVAQVVYRVLGTWDPEVIAWVVRANRLELDKRGNPRIHPDQELRIPAEARSGQSASINGFGGY